MRARTLYHPRIRVSGSLTIDNIGKLVYIVLEKLICNNIDISKNRHGKNVLVATRVFKEIWRDSVLRDVYLDLCSSEYHVCRDHGPLIIRNYLFNIMKYYDGPVTEYLKSSLFGKKMDLCRICEKIVRNILEGD